MKKILIILLFPSLTGLAQRTVLYDTLLVRRDSAWVAEIKKSEGMMKDGLKIGVWQTWYSDGQLSDSGEYAIYEKNNLRIYDADNSSFSYADTIFIMNTLKEKYSLPVGKWISYYRNGQVLETGTYLAVGMVKTSTALVPGEDGELIYTEVIAEPEGVKTGEWTYYVETGKMVLKESYTEGLKAGEVFMQEEVK